MKISKSTINILKNFAGIKSSILLEAGSVIKTKTLQNTLMVTATIEETLPLDFAVYDLNEFLNVIGLFQDPDLEFSDSYVKITQDKNSIKYYAADRGLIEKDHPTKQVNFPEPDISFDLTADILSQIKKISSTINAPDLSFIGVDGVLKFVVSDKKNPTSNAFEYIIGETDKTFNIDYKVDMMKLLNLNYTIYISAKRISKFVSSDNSVVYYVGVEMSSTFPQ